MSLDSVISRLTKSFSKPEWSNPLRLKNRFVELFQNILNDQSDSVTHPIYKSKWTTSDRQSVEALDKEFRGLEINEQTACEECMGPLENIACRLSPVIKAQLGKIEIRGLPPASRIKGERGEVIVDGKERCFRSPLFEGEVVITFSGKAGKSIFQGDTYVDGFDNLKLVNADIFQAADDLDYFYRELFSRRLCKRDIPKAVESLAKLSYASIKEVGDHLTPVADYCHDLLKKNTTQEVGSIYESCLTEVNGAFLIKCLNEKLLALDQNYQDQIKSIMTSLKPATMAKIQGWVEECLDKDKISTAAACLEILLPCDEYASWCQPQLALVIQKYIKIDKTDMAMQLIDKYLWNHSTTTQTNQCIIELIRSYVQQGSINKVMELLDKLNKPETHAQAIAIIEDAIRIYIKGEGIKENEVGDSIEHTMLLLDKYLWMTPEHPQAVRLVKEWIEKMLEKHAMDTAYKLIGKYVLDSNHRAIRRGNNYINHLISQQIDKNLSAASKLYDRYMSLESLITEIEFDNCCRLILKNTHFGGAENMKRQLELDIRKIIILPDLTDEHKKILRNFVQKMAPQLKYKIVSFLCIAKAHIKDQQFVKELATLFVQNAYDPELTQSIQALFLSQV